MGRHSRRGRAPEEVRGPAADGGSGTGGSPYRERAGRPRLPLAGDGRAPSRVARPGEDRSTPVHGTAVDAGRQSTARGGHPQDQPPPWPAAGGMVAGGAAPRGGPRQEYLDAFDDPTDDVFAAGAPRARREGPTDDGAPRRRPGRDGRTGAGRHRGARAGRAGCREGRSRGRCGEHVPRDTPSQRTGPGLHRQHGGRRHHRARGRHRRPGHRRDARHPQIRRHGRRRHEAARRRHPGGARRTLGCAVPAELRGRHVAGVPAGRLAARTGYLPHRRGRCRGPRRRDRTDLPRRRRGRIATRRRAVRRGGAAHHQRPAQLGARSRLQLQPRLHGEAGLRRSLSPARARRMCGAPSPAWTPPSSTSRATPRPHRAS